MRTRLLFVCLLPLALLAPTACTTSGDGAAVASAGGAATPAATPSLSRLDLLTRLSQCMREHGVPMTDPEVDGDIVRQGTTDKDAVSEETTARAEQACLQYRPPQETGPLIDFKKEVARQFSRCMREQGVERYPDPNPDGPTRIGRDIGDDPQYRQARAFCDAQAQAASASLRPTP